MAHASSDGAYLERWRMPRAMATLLRFTPRVDTSGSTRAGRHERVDTRKSPQIRLSIPKPPQELRSRIFAHTAGCGDCYIAPSPRPPRRSAAVRRPPPLGVGLHVCSTRFQKPFSSTTCARSSSCEGPPRQVALEHVTEFPLRRSLREHTLYQSVDPLRWVSLRTEAVAERSTRDHRRWFVLLCGDLVRERCVAACN